MSTAIERMFGEDFHKANSDDMRWNPRNGTFEDFYEYRIKMMVEDARSYNMGQRAPKREMAMRYLQGIEPYLDEEGRSTIVSTDVRDTIYSIMPSLMRIFTSHENVVEYIPNNESMVDIAEQATDYVTWVVMEDNRGFLMLHDVFKDTLTKGEAAVKWWTDDNPTVTTREYKSITMDQVQYIVNGEENQIEVVKLNYAKSQGGKIKPPKPEPAPAAPSADPAAMPATGGAPGQPAPPLMGDPEETTEGPTGDENVYDLIVKITTSKPITRVEAVPPDEFRIDRYAKGVHDAVLIGQETVKTPSDLILMGYPKELVDQYKGTSIASARWNEERSIRNHGLDEGVGGPDINGGVLFGEYYIRVDKDGDGIAELRLVCVMGDKDEIVRDEPVDVANYAMFCADPEPHTAIGHSISELVMDIQKIKTNILRNSLDGLAQTIYPRLAVVESQVNLDDVLNNELGAPIRMKSPNAVTQLGHQFIGDAPMSMMAYLDSLAQKRTGISEASKGLDPKALQSTTVKGVDMVISGAQERIELIARILAETGVKDMFKGLLREVTDNPNPGRVIKIRDKWVPVVMDAYDPSMSVRVNPAIGRGSDTDRFNMLMQVIAKQELVMSTMGPANPMVSPIEYRNAIQDVLSIAGMKNVSRYFKPVSQQQVQQMGNQPPPPNPALILAQNETEKTRANVVKHVSDDNFRNQKLQLDEDFRRDRLITDALVKGTSIHAQYGTAIDSKALDAQIAADKHATMMGIAHSNNIRDLLNGNSGNNATGGTGQGAPQQPTIPGSNGQAA